MNRRWWWQIIGVLGFALVVPATLAQTQVQERVVTRPDGSVVYPLESQPEPRGSALWPRDRGAVTDEQERRRAETQQDRLERQQQRMRERDAALQNPARQIAPTQGH